MGRLKNVGKFKVDSSHGLKMLNFVGKLLKLSHTERVEHFKATTFEEFNLISEIASDFIICNMKYDTKSFHLLKGVK